MALFAVFVMLLITGCCIADSGTEDAMLEEEEDDITSTTMVGKTEKSASYEKDLPEASPLLSENSGYRMPGLYDLNGGEPFYLEKDPITGKVDFGTRTQPLRKTSNMDHTSLPSRDSIEGEPSLKNHKISESDIASDDYYYDEEEEGDKIDRKDTTFSDIRRDYPPTINDVNTNHKYQNDHSNKFPLISSSYANTKVQGTAVGINRNHRPLTTSSTHSPSYYTLRPQPTLPTYSVPSRGTVKYKQSDETKPTTTTTQSYTETRPSPSPYPSTNPPPSTKTTEQPSFYYEEEANEDYDTESPTGFSLSELFGYGKPSSKPEEKKPQQEDNPKQSLHQDSLPFTTQSPQTSLSTTTRREEISFEDRHQVTVQTTNKPVTSQTPGIIYSEVPSAARPQPIATSLPINIEEHQPHKHRPVLHQPVSSVADFDPKQSDDATLKTPTVQNATQQSKPTYLTVSSNVQNRPTSGLIGNKPISNSPYGEFAEEPFRPIFGPVQFENRPPLQRPESPQLSSTDKNINTNNPIHVSKPVVVDDVIKSKIPQESPSRWNYPVNEGISPFFQLPPSYHRNQDSVPTISPPRIPGVEPPRPNLQYPPFRNITSPQRKPPLLPHPPNPVVNIIPDRGNDHQRPVPSEFHEVWTENNKKNGGGHVPSEFHEVWTENNKKNGGGHVPSEFHEVWTENNKKNGGGHVPSEFHEVWTENNKKNGGGHVVFPDSRPELSRPQDEGLRNPITTVTVQTKIDSIGKEESSYQLPPKQRPGHEEMKPAPNQQRPPTSTHTLSRPVSQSGPPIPHRDFVDEPSQELKPPAEPDNVRKHVENYPRPQWESHVTGQHQYLPHDSSHIARPKHDAPQAQFGQSSSNFGNGYRGRPGYPPENTHKGNRPQQHPNIRSQDSNLPNILPQFRPNAKLGHVHPEGGGRIQVHPYYGSQRQPLLERPNRRPQHHEYMGHLYPRPPPQYRRVNRNDSPVPPEGFNKVDDMFQFEKYPPQQRPLVHRRTGPHVTDMDASRPQVSTLQMMQQGSNSHFIPRPLTARDDFPDTNDEMKPPFQVKYPSGSSLNTETSEKQPVFVVYPINSTPLNSGTSNSQNNGVVVGTRGPQRPLPPSNLNPDSSSAEEMLHNKQQKPLLQLASDRLDNPSFQSQSPTALPLKSDFPYPLEKPDAFTDTTNNKDNEKEYDVDKKEISTILDSITPSSNDRYDHEFSLTNDDIEAEVHNSHNDNHDEDDTDINIIPYLQDYMPFATKKPLPAVKLQSEKSSSTVPSSVITMGSVKTSTKPEKDNQWTTMTGNGNRRLSILQPQLLNHITHHRYLLSSKQFNHQ
ncbi:hypothetical protein ANN_22897 [Periplaneta americana]|uniref:Uncharacterized protein n=1 Tax=Periplaneta americana TaxID=6978 RepID=A0ABQ8SJK7_PERAM|nr:hypothetical protein ANN_22897 [Periplaneta americana]